MADRELYFDEDVSQELVDLLRAAGFTVHLPQDLGTISETDALHLGVAARHGWILVTRNRRDFRRLHWLWTSLNTWGALPLVHSGIVTIYEGESRPGPEEWAAAIIRLFEQQTSLSGAMYMWRPSTGAWQFQQPSFM